MTLDLDKLEALAKAATPGPWQVPPGALSTVTSADRPLLIDGGTLNDAQYIAALSPDVALKLIALARISSAMAAMIENEGRKRDQASRGGQHVTNTGDLASCPPSTLARLEWWAREIRAVTKPSP